jgi:hypothetical protein
MDLKEQNITKTELHAERLITELILMGKIYTRPVAPHVKVGRRFKFKWKQDVWYTGTVLRVDKKNKKNKKNEWWNVRWDDGIKQRVLLSNTNISRWCLI